MKHKLLLGSHLVLSVATLAVSVGAQNVPASTNLNGGLPGVAGLPAYSPTGTPYSGYTVHHKITGAPNSTLGILTLGLSRADMPLFGGTLIPSPDFTATLVTDANGATSYPMNFTGVPAGLPIYGQGLFIDGQAPGGFSFSNGAKINTFTNASDAALWSSMETLVPATFGKLLSTRDALPSEIDAIARDIRTVSLTDLVAAAFPLTTDLTGTEVSTYQVPAGIHSLYVVPLMTASGASAGAIMLHNLGDRDAIGLAVIGGQTGNNFIILGPDGDQVSMNFTEDLKFLGPTDLVTVAGDPDWWKLFKQWLTNDGGAAGMPWWYHFVCGIVCGGALLAPTPLTISACIHCIGGYLLACVPMPGPA
jgi:hypothetical protein